ncbi:Tol-Pal system beta propeller repeat protein TolB [Flagellatimonas centrodinii]|uniref:Tol-Pal system beta propeller repeat protein TolB n=1 Tax=Flagellatimonas centrodinii TaxID=2806210 RepID=UPI001FFC34A3|nr:Tol-Pal system beta propeller repeat protein TolB [Flagellatimonas centrodinii]ULQ46473.1 Tol-Pal system beta propeller repeat protein TolB [Flagellatimonas centrodinii]
MTSQYSIRWTRRLVATLMLLVSAGASAQLEITVTGGVERAAPIAIVPFSSPESIDFDVARIIEADLARTGLFDTLSRNDMLETPSDIAQFNSANWRAVSMDNVVIGQLRLDPNTGNVGARFWLVDALRNQQLLGFDMPAVPPAQLRYLAHQIADLVFEKLTGFPGAFNTRIAYVAADGLGYQRRFELVIADADGFNPRTVATSREPIMSPAWAPDRRHIAYVGYERGRSAVYIHELESGKVRKLVSERGINGSPTWSPDGSRMAVTLSFESNPDIYVIDLTSGQRTRLTEHFGIDTEPAWAPDGESLVFTSDRGGQPQIYRIAATGGNPERITFDGKQNLKASYSPDGKTLVLVNYDQGSYRIATMELETRRLTRLTDGRLDESPGFAPNGAVIIYATQSGNSAELATVSLDGRVKTRLRQAGDVREPAWSPLAR